MKSLSPKRKSSKKTNIFVVHPYYGFSPGDVSNYFSKGFSNLGEDVFNFFSERHITYHSLSSTQLYRIGVMKSKFTLRDVRDNVSLHLLGSLYVKKPEIIFIVHGIEIDSWVFEEMRNMADTFGSKMVLVTTESPYQKNDELRISKYFDYIFTTDLSGQEYLDAEYIGHSYCKSVHNPVPAYKIPRKYIVDIGFIGAFFSERAKLFEKIIDRDYTTFLSGVIPESEEFISDKIIKRVRPDIIQNFELPYLYSGAKFSPNFTRRSEDLYDVEEDQKQAQKSVTIRMVEVLSSGGVLITDETEELKGSFEEGTHYIGFSTQEEFLDKLDFYMNNIKELSKIRIAGNKRIKEVKRSYTENCRYILDRVRDN